MVGWAGSRRGPADVLCSTIGTGVRAPGALAGSERAIIRRMLIGGLFVDPPPPNPISVV